MDFRSGTRSRGGDLVASTERTLHRYDSDFAKSRFRRQMRAARWTTPSLRLRSVVTGTFQLPAPFEPNPTLPRPPLPWQCPTESMEVILPHSIYIPGKSQNIRLLLQIYIKEFCYEANHIRLSGVVPLLQSCWTRSMLIYRCLSAACIDASDRLVNSGRPSGMSGRTVGRQTPFGQDRLQNAVKVLSCFVTIYWQCERLCIQQSRSYRKEHKIMKWKHLLNNAHLKEGIFRALARGRSVVQGSHTEHVCVCVCVCMYVCMCVTDCDQERQ